MLVRRDRSKIRGYSLAVAIGILVGGASAARGDAIGLSELQSIEPSLTGAGVAVAQAEANTGTADVFEVNPAFVNQPIGIFTYTSDLGTASTFANAVGTESTHADAVGAIFYGNPSGVAPGVQSVDNYLADTFANVIVPNLTPIRAQVVNQSFIATGWTISDQQTSDSQYDDYVAKYGTIIVSGAGNSGPINPPATAYNSIAVSVDDGSSSYGPTLDNGRSKPDITGPGGATSYSTPLVAGAATLLVQAGNAGLGGSSPSTEAAAVDARTIKALLLNGATKPGGWHHTPTAPLDPNFGAGAVNVYNSFEQLHAGQFSPSSTTNTLTVGGLHPAIPLSPINSLAGWNLATLTSSSIFDAYDNYVFSLPGGPLSYTLTSTLVWERPMGSSTSNPINNFYLYLYDATTNLLSPIDTSDSTVDNVQELYDLGLTGGDTYDIEVLKTGGNLNDPGVISYPDTYALAVDFAAVPEPTSGAMLLASAITLLSCTMRGARSNSSAVAPSRRVRV